MAQRTMADSMRDNCDRLVNMIEDWADKSGYKLEDNKDYQQICEQITEAELNGVPAGSYVHIFYIIDLFFREYVTSLWELTSTETGEIFSLYGLPGENLKEAMDRMGLVWGKWIFYRKIY